MVAMLWSESTQQLCHSSKQSTKEEIGKSGNKNVHREKSHVAWNGMRKYGEALCTAHEVFPMCVVRSVHYVLALFY